MIPRHVLAAVLPLEVLKAEVDDAIVEVLAAEMRVAGRRFHLEDPVFDGKQRNVEGAAPHVVDEDITLAGTLLVQSVGDRRCRWLIDNTEHIHP
mmetsp:Transcript_23633/g.50251  ORF Transcript_23633/g.50251 Transcript_23633/m.50251 type:complete len:94 (+) Transcript_23633:361-642(+)